MIELTPEVGGLSSRPNQALTCRVTPHRTNPPKGFPFFRDGTDSDSKWIRGPGISMEGVHQNSALPGVRGKGITSRMFVMPVT